MRSRSTADRSMRLDPTLTPSPFAKQWRGAARAVAPALLVLAMGCTVPPLNKTDARFPAGSTVVLNSPVEVPAGQAGVYLRGYSEETRYQYQTTCRLEVRTLSQGSTVIEPDRFTVLGTSYDREALTGPAYPGPLDGFNSIGDGGGLVYANTYIYLQSAQQPDVLRLKCRQLQDNYRVSQLSSQQIQTALGDSMTIVR